MEFRVVDAFSHGPFTGNPAGVVFCRAPLDAGLMQNIAGEIGLAETAFVYPLAHGMFSIRWFTPTVEAPLCGHATLASSHAIWEAGLAPTTDALEFESQSGPLGASWQDGAVELDFPSEPCAAWDGNESEFKALFGDSLRFIGSNRLDFLVELDCAESVRSYQPNFERLAALGRGVIVTAPSDREEFDFVSRVFAPSEGIPEDPVTGSAHCCLAPYWSERTGKIEMVGYQASRRGGVVMVECLGERTRLRGRAVTVVSGCLHL